MGQSAAKHRKMKVQRLDRKIVGSSDPKWGITAKTVKDIV